MMIGTPNSGDILANFFDGSHSCKPAVFDLEFSWPLPNDALVPVSSVESLAYSESLGHTLHCHMSLLGEPEYEQAQSVLIGG
jgi:hypothetical protein